MREYLETNGLIFPVVFRGFESLPAEIANNRQCIKFDDVITEADFKSRNRLKKIDELARKIYESWEEMERSGVFINHDCSQFRFPEGEVAAWLNQHAKRSPARMPGR